MHDDRRRTAGAAQDVSLRGRVSDAGGEPLVGVAVTAVAADVADLRAAPVTTTTDAAGKYELVLGAGTWAGHLRARRLRDGATGRRLTSRRGSPVSST